MIQNDPHRVSTMGGKPQLTGPGIIYSPSFDWILHAPASAGNAPAGVVGIGNFAASLDVELLRAEGVNSIIRVGAPHRKGEAGPRRPDPSIPFYEFPLADGPGNARGVFLAAIKAISVCREQHSSVMVHCAAGVSRSASVVAGYLILNEGMTVDAAIAFIKARRPIIAIDTELKIMLGKIAQTSVAPEEASLSRNFFTRMKGFFKR